MVETIKKGEMSLEGPVYGQIADDDVAGPDEYGTAVQPSSGRQPQQFAAQMPQDDEELYEAIDLNEGGPGAPAFPSKKPQQVWC